MSGAYSTHSMHTNIQTYITVTNASMHSLTFVHLLRPHIKRTQLGPTYQSVNSTKVAHYTLSIERISTHPVRVLWQPLLCTFTALHCTMPMMANWLVTTATCTRCSLDNVPRMPNVLATFTMIPFTRLCEKQLFRELIVVLGILLNDLRWRLDDPWSLLA